MTHTYDLIDPKFQWKRENNDKGKRIKQIVSLIFIYLLINFTTLQKMMESWGRGQQDTKSHIKTSLIISRNKHRHTHTRKTSEALKN